MTSSKLVLVCQHTTCRKQGSAKVLEAFQASPVAGVTVKGSSCLGQCGNGPTVLILPEKIWHRRVCPDEIPRLIAQHLQPGQPVGNQLHPDCCSH